MRVIIVDDHTIVREGIRWMLINEPSIEVIAEASGGVELLDLLDREEADVVLLDVRMPQMSGLDVLSALSQRESAPPVLMLSMYAEASLVQQAIALGAAGYIKKNADRDELIRAIQAVGGGGSYLQGELTRPLLAEVGGNPSQPVSVLSPDDRRILALVAEGMGNREIALQLECTEISVRTALQSLFRRLGVSTRSGAVAAALRLGAID